MGLARSLYTGVSGILSHQKRLDVVGDNIANVNTTGFKEGRAMFSTQFSQLLTSGTAPNDTSGNGGQNPQQIGLGVKVQSITKNFTQGGIEVTGRQEDLAIDGQGFFIVKQGSNDVNASTYYTRDGSFTLSRASGSQSSGAEDRYLVTTDGYYVQGIMYDADPNLNVRADKSEQTRILIPIGETYQHETTALKLSGTLNSAGDVSITGSTVQVSNQLVDRSQYAATGVLLPISGYTRLVDLAYANAPSQSLFSAKAGENKLYFESRIGGSLVRSEAFQVRNDTTLHELLSAQTDFMEITNPDGPATAGVGSVSVTHGPLPRYGINVGVDYLTFPQLQNEVPAPVTNATHLAADWGGGDFVNNWPGGAAVLVGDTLTFTGKVGNQQTILTHTVTAADTVATLAQLLADVFQAEAVTVENGVFQMIGATGAESTISNLSVQVNANEIWADYGTLNNVTHNTQPVTSLAATLLRSAGATATGATLLDAVDATSFADGVALNGGDVITISGYLGSQFVTANLPVVAGVTNVNALLAAIQATFPGSTASLNSQGRIMVQSPGVDPQTQVITGLSLRVNNTDKLEIYNGGTNNGNTKNGTLNINGNLGAPNALTDVKLLRNNETASVFSYDTTTIASGSGASSAVQVYDKTGAPHQVYVRLNMISQDANETRYRWVASSPSDAALIEGFLGSANPTPPDGQDRSFEKIVGEGIISFNLAGNYQASYAADNQTLVQAPTVKIDIAGRELNLPISFKDITSIAVNNPLVVTRQEDGFPVGTLDTYSVATDGVVIGYYSNGYYRDLARVAVATFQNNNGLISQGANLFTEGVNSGPATCKIPGQNGAGVVREGSLEQSNVDLAREFTNLITTQRGFQASARTITTTDTMLQELLNIV